MSANFVIHGMIAVVLYDVFLFERLAIKRIANGEGKIVGIHCLGVRIGTERKFYTGIGCLYNGKFLVSRKAMSSDFVSGSIQRIFLIFESADDRE